MSGRVLITGGCGFVGTNLADRLLREGVPVTVLDSLIRPGVRKNLEWLRRTHGERDLRVKIADLRDRRAVDEAVADADAVYHFAAQVAVTTSLVDPFDDFLVNTMGTIGLLEAVRRKDEPPAVVFTSTNKVYGALDDVPLVERGSRYEPADPVVRARGVAEDRPLDFHSPYGCSKGAADQYVLDYARSFGIPAVVFRMSCIYGLHQFGNEDQGWVAHFLIRALHGEPITIYGDGKQVRDVLFVDDLVQAMRVARERMDDIAGRAFNIGGGPERTTSLLELIATIAEIQGERPRVVREAWRASDQRYYVSDVGAFRAATGWQPRVSVEEGVRRLHAWLAAEHRPARRARVAAPLEEGVASP